MSILEFVATGVVVISIMELVREYLIMCDCKSRLCPWKCKDE